MKVAFLTLATSMHVNIKAKYFDERDDRVYFFAMKFRHKLTELNVPVNYSRNMKIMMLEHEDYDWKLILDNAMKMLRVIRSNKIEIVHIIEMTYAAYAVVLRLMGVRVVIENNGSDVLLAPKNERILKWYRWAYHLSNAVVQDSEIAQNAGIALGAGRENNQVIELGIDTDIFNPSVRRGVFRKKYAIPEDAKVIFSPRSFRPLDNIREIIETIEPITKKYPDVYFVFCSYQKNWKYQKLIESATDHAIYLGYVDNEQEMPYIYRDSDIVLSIPNSDSSPRTVYEAMACGSNVIVSDLPWVHKKFTDGKELFIVELHNKQKLIEVIENILDGNIRIDQNVSYKKIREVLDYRISKNKLRMLYEKIL